MTPDTTTEPARVAEFSDLDRLRCAEREVKQRRHVYKRLVERGRMSPQKAAMEIGIMESIADDYRRKVDLFAGGST